MQLHLTYKSPQGHHFLKVTGRHVALGHFRPDSVGHSSCEFFHEGKKAQCTSSCAKASCPPQSDGKKTLRLTHLTLPPQWESRALPPLFTPAPAPALWEGEEQALESGYQGSNPESALTSLSTLSRHHLPTDPKSLGKVSPPCTPLLRPHSHP